LFAFGLLSLFAPLFVLGSGICTCGLGLAYSCLHHNHSAAASITRPHEAHAATPDGDCHGAAVVPSGADACQLRPASTSDSGAWGGLFSLSPWFTLLGSTPAGVELADAGGLPPDSAGEEASEPRFSDPPPPRSFGVA
jgi:hypothetical protein